MAPKTTFGKNGHVANRHKPETRFAVLQFQCHKDEKWLVYDV